MLASRSGAVHCCCCLRPPRLWPASSRFLASLPRAAPFLRFNLPPHAFSSISRAARATAAIRPGMEPTPSYEDAIRLLNSTQAGFKTIEERKKANVHLNEAEAMGQMRAWLRCLGYAPEDLDRLNVVHVAGTKGKGTTCAYTNSILERYRRRQAGAGEAKGQGRGPHKIGLYTSPHLVAVRERIRINSTPLSEELFARYFFEVWRALEEGEKKAAAQGEGASKPSYFRFLTLLSFHVFLREGVDVAVYEVGVGGALDATNVVVHPAATAITTLGIDHVSTLGHTLASIAWHKAGILKPASPAFTVQQEGDGEEGAENTGAAAMAVLRQRAAERQTELTVLSPARCTALLQHVRLTPSEPFQRKNAALAVASATTVLRRLGVADAELPRVADGAEEAQTALEEDHGDTLPALFIDGLENVLWRGRCETKTTGPMRWYLDGAHNRQSLDVACQWFGRVVEEGNNTMDRPPPNVLIFNQQSERDAVDLLRVVHRTLSEHGDHGLRFQHAVFCTNMTYKNKSWKVDFVNNNVDPAAVESLSLQRTLAAEWQRLDPQAEVAAVPSIEDAVDYVRSRYAAETATRKVEDGEVRVRVLITGSFHLIGGALTVLEEGEAFAMDSIAA